MLTSTVDEVRAVRRRETEGGVLMGQGGRGAGRFRSYGRWDEGGLRSFGGGVCLGILLSTFYSLTAEEVLLLDCLRR